MHEVSNVDVKQDNTDHLGNCGVTIDITDDDNDENLMTKPEQELFNLLDLHPCDKESKEKFRHRECAISVLARLHPSAFRKKYPIKGYRTSPGKRIFPLTPICALGASLSTIQAVYDLHQEAALETLTYCAFRACPLEVIKFLVEPRHAVLEQADEFGFTALHYSSCLKRGSKETLKYLVSINEATLIMQTCEGNTPLHHSCSYRLQLEKVKLLVDKDGIAVQMKNKLGDTPLHVACCKNAPLAVIECLVDAFPAALEMANNQGHFPLHLACRSKCAPLDVIQLLIQRNSSAMTRKSSFGRLPLHCVCFEGGHAETLRFLATKNSALLKEPDAFGDLAIHVASRKSDAASVKALLDLMPATILAKNVWGHTPFFEACEAGNAEVVKCLATECPSMLKRKDHKDDGESWTPLHRACSKGNKAVIKVLLDLYPQAAKEVDRKGRTPLALLSRNAGDSDMEIIQLVVDAYPAARSMVDHDGNPAMNNDQKDALITYLLEEARPAKRAKIMFQDSTTSSIPG